jgi:hypothetical protein
VMARDWFVGYETQHHHRPCVSFFGCHLVHALEGSRSDYRGIIHKEIVPELGKMKVAAVDFEDAGRRH